MKCFIYRLGQRGEAGEEKSSIREAVDVPVEFCMLCFPWAVWHRVSLVQCPLNSGSLGPLGACSMPPLRHWPSVMPRAP